MMNDKNALAHDFDDEDARCLSPAEVCSLLSIKKTKLYELLKGGHFETFRVGGARRITLASVKRFVRSQIAAESDQGAGTAGAVPEND